MGSAVPETNHMTVTAKDTEGTKNARIAFAFFAFFAVAISS